ncbi:MAG: hypothetical protein I8H94_00800 [Rhodobacteraceae bacterium]|nr:hypothetical protein [Paracoccaceae bacterium]
MQHHITVVPVAGRPGAPDDTASARDATVIVCGVAYDLSGIPLQGEAQCDGDHPFVGPILRDDNGLHYGLILKYDTATACPDQPTDALHWLVQVADADVPDLITRKGVPE